MRHSWQSVRKEIHGWILNGQYQPGDKLPRDQDIAIQLGCARSTVVRAMQDLSEEGIVNRRRKGGTEVARHRTTRGTVEIPVHRLDIEAGGHVYGYKLLAVETQVLPDDTATHFNITTIEKCLHIRALHLSDNQPHIYEDRWVSLTTASGIKDADLENISANEWLVRHCPYDGIKVAFSAIPSSPELTSILGAQSKAAHFCMERKTEIRGEWITAVTSVFQPGYRMWLD